MVVLPSLVTVVGISGWTLFWVLLAFMLFVHSVEWLAHPDEKTWVQRTFAGVL